MLPSREQQAEISGTVTMTFFIPSMVTVDSFIHPAGVSWALAVTIAVLDPELKQCGYKTDQTPGHEEIIT